MKYLILISLLIPSLAFAGNHHDKSPLPSPHMVSPPGTPVGVPSSPPSVPTSAPAPVTPTSQGGTQPVCSGPTSVGWHVDIPGGGCAPVVTVPLSSLPRTGFGPPVPALVLLLLVVVYAGFTLHYLIKK